MLIRSQDKKILVDMNTVIIHIFDRDIACYARHVFLTMVFYILEAMRQKKKL